MNAPKVEKYPEDYKFKDIKKELLSWDNEFRGLVKVEEDKALEKLKILTKKMMKYESVIKFTKEDIRQVKIMLERINNKELI